METPSAVKFPLPVTIAIIPDVLVTNLITKLYQSCLVVMTSQTMQAGMKFSITGTQNSHVPISDPCTFRLWPQCIWTAYSDS